MTIGNNTFSVLETSRLLGVSDQTVYNMIKQGILNCMNIGSRKVFSRLHLTEYLGRGDDERGERVLDSLMGERT